MIEGSIWLLKVIFRGCIFLSFSTKIKTYWSILQRSRKFVPICIFDCKSRFFYIFRSIFSKKFVKFRVGNKNFEKLGKYQKFWVEGENGERGAKIHTWGCGAISPNRNTKHCKGPIFMFVNEIYITDKGDMLKWHCFLKEHSDH